MSIDCIEWKVTKDGLEAGDYWIAADRLDQVRTGTENLPDWIFHAGGKSWIDLEQFVLAFRSALVAHGYTQTFTEAQITEAYEKTRANKAAGEQWNREYNEWHDRKYPERKSDIFRCSTMGDFEEFEEWRSRRDA